MFVNSSAACRQTSAVRLALPARLFHTQREAQPREIKQLSLTVSPRLTALAGGKPQLNYPPSCMLRYNHSGLIGGSSRAPLLSVERQKMYCPNSGRRFLNIPSCSTVEASLSVGSLTSAVNKLFGRKPFALSRLNKSCCVYSRL